MYGQPDPQYTYHQDPTQPQSFYPAAPQNPHLPYYPAQQNIYQQPVLQSTEQPIDTSQPSAYGYASQYSSPTDLSPSPSSNDPELKRIRNTAASARFRAKKKRREASLERNAKDKRDALEKLEARIRELEAENKFLKGLIFDKEKLDGVKSELDRARELEKELKRDLDIGKKEGKRDDGVGTWRET